MDQGTDDLLARAHEILASVGFDPDRSVLTRRQAEVLVLRERDVAQRTIAEALGTSRANVSSVESTARENLAKARETVALADAIRAPVRIRIDPGVPLIDVPERVYAAADAADTKVAASAPTLQKRVTEQAGEAVADGQVTASLFVAVAADGSVTIRHADDDR